MFPKMGPLRKQMPISRAFFYISLEFPNKIFPNKKRNLSLLSKALGKERTPHVPQNGAPTETDAHFQSIT